MQHEFVIDHRLHYLNDFLHSSIGFVAANQQLTIPLRAFTYLGIPLCYIQARRTITIIDLSSFVLDSECHEARLPEDKLSEICTPLMATISGRSIGQRQLDSLLGKLTFAAQVIVPGRTFMRQL